MEKAYRRIISEVEKDAVLIQKNGIFNYYKTTDETGRGFGGSLFSPFEMSLFCSGEYYIKVCPLIYDDVIAFLDESKYNFFSDSEINKFLGYMSEIFNRLNWSVDSRSYVYSTIYTLEDYNLLNVSKILNTTVEITAPTDKYINISGSVYKINDTSNSNTYFCTVLDDKIVSICGYSYMGFESVDIGITTNENYRQRGYATSNVISMAKYILDKGKGVFYSCKHTNTASQKTALSAGFTHNANRYILFCNK